MPSRRAEIAQAVTDALTAASGTSAFSDVAFTVSRKAVPANKQSDLANLTLTVVPIGHETRTLVKRKTVEKQLTIEIGVQKRISTDCDPESPEGNPEIDALMLFAEQVAHFFEPDAESEGDIGDSGASWMASEVPLTYDPDHLRRLRTFTSSVSLTVRYY